MADLDLFVTCAPGLERLLATELVELAGKRRVGKPEPGGVPVRGPGPLAFRLNLRSGLATRVLLRVGSFTARSLRKLRKKAAELPWKSLLGGACRPELKVSLKDSRLRSGGEVARSLERVLGEAFGEAAEDAPPVTILLRLEQDRCTVSIDTSGEPLHRRGWRQQTAKAPLREDLARALLVASSWKVGKRLIDPMAGSGTIAIEAARMAREIAPGKGRSFAFEHLALADAAGIARQRAEAEARELPLCPAPIFARDRVEGALRAIEGNAERAGVSADLTVELADLEEVPLPRVAAVVTNPPYGQRIAGAGSALRALDTRLAELGPGVRIGLVAPTGPRVRRTRLACAGLQSALMTDHGGTKVVFLTGRTKKPRAKKKPAQEE